jgi:hypothetical protein
MNRAPSSFLGFNAVKYGKSSVAFWRNKKRPRISERAKEGSKHRARN